MRRVGRCRAAGPGPTRGCGRCPSAAAAARRPRTPPRGREPRPGLGALRAHDPVGARAGGSRRGCASKNAQPPAARIAAPRGLVKPRLPLERVDGRAVLTPSRRTRPRRPAASGPRPGAPRRARRSGRSRSSRPAAGVIADRRPAVDGHPDAVDPADAQDLVDDLRPGHGRQARRLRAHARPTLATPSRGSRPATRAARRARRTRRCRGVRGGPSADSLPAGAPGAVDWSRMTRDELILRTRQLIAEGERLDGAPLADRPADLAPAVRRPPRRCVGHHGPLPPRLADGGQAEGDRPRAGR